MAKKEKEKKPVLNFDEKEYVIVAGVPSTKENVFTIPFLLFK